MVVFASRERGMGHTASARRANNPVGDHRRVSPGARRSRKIRIPPLAPRPPDSARGGDPALIGALLACVTALGGRGDTQDAHGSSLENF